MKKLITNLAGMVISNLTYQAVGDGIQAVKRRRQQRREDDLELQEYTNRETNTNEDDEVLLTSEDGEDEQE